MSQQASIIEYGGPGHTEHSFVYASTEWAELGNLLQSPSEFLRVKGNENSPIAWVLLPGSTVIVEPMDTSYETAVRSAYILKIAGPEAAWEERSLDAIRAALIPGSFIAEFAAYTRTLWIRYWLPEDVKDKKFRGIFVDPVTHAPVVGLPVGNMHVDIATALGKTERHRAQFIVDYIEDATRFTDELNAKAKDQKLRNESILANTGSQEPELAISTNYQEETLKYKPMKGLKRVVIEGMSIPELPQGYFVCIDGDTRTDGQFILVGGVLVKCYAGPKPVGP